MRPACRHLLRLIAALLLLQWGTALGHCLQRHGNAGLLLEICTTDGIRHVLVGSDDAPAPDQAPEAGVCVACPVPHAMLAPQPLQPSAPVLYVFVDHQPPPAGLPVAPPRAPPQQPRAPPAA